MTGSLTGDEATDAMVGPAQSLVWAVRLNDGEAITRAFLEASEHVDGDMYRAAAGLAVVLAAMVPDDGKPEDLLHWTVGDRDMYLELRRDGLCSSAAAMRAAAYRADQERAAGRVLPFKRGRVTG